MITRQATTSSLRSAAVLFALTLAVAACGGPEDDASGEPTTVATTASTPAPDDTGSIDASGDRFCEITQEGIELTAQAMAETEAAFADLAAAAAAGDTGLSGLVEVGVTIEDMGTRSKELYSEAVTYVEDPAVVDAFNELGSFIDLYSLPVAELMQNATSFEQLGADLAALVGQPEVTAILESAATHQAVTEAYTEERCGIEI